MILSAQISDLIYSKKKFYQNQPFWEVYLITQEVLRTNLSHCHFVWSTELPINHLHPPKFNIAPDKMMVGRRPFPFGMIYFQGRVYSSKISRTVVRDGRKMFPTATYIEVFRASQCPFPPKKENLQVRHFWKKTMVGNNCGIIIPEKGQKLLVVLGGGSFRFRWKGQAPDR